MGTPWNVENGPNNLESINLYSLRRSAGTAHGLTDRHKGIINEATVRMQISVGEGRREGEI